MGSIQTKSLNLFSESPSPEEGSEVLLAYHLHRLAVRTDDGYIILPIHQIIFIQADSNYSILHLVNGKKIMTSKTLKVWENKISHPFFIRCHRSYYINISYIDKLNNKMSFVEMLGQCIPFARSFRFKLIDPLKKII